MKPPLRPQQHSAKRLPAKSTPKTQAGLRIKEAVGDLTGDKDLQREGKVDQTAGKAKDVVDNASDKVKDKLDRD